MKYIPKIFYLEKNKMVDNSSVISCEERKAIPGKEPLTSVQKKNLRHKYKIGRYRFHPKRLIVLITPKFPTTNTKVNMIYTKCDTVLSLCRTDFWFV